MRTTIESIEGNVRPAPEGRSVHLRNRIWYLFAVVATIVFGLTTRRFPEFVPGFLGKYPGDALWALMVFLGWGIVFPGASSVRNATMALTVSYAVELLKLEQVPWLVGLRQSTLGHLVFGRVFTWQNFIAYAVGVAFGMVGEHFFVRDRERIATANG